NAPTAELDTGGSGGVVRGMADEGALSGPMTRMNLARAEAEAARARALYIAGEPLPPAVPAGVQRDDSSGIMIVRDDDIEPEPIDVPSGPREVGDLREMSALALVYRIAKARGTGMLALEGRAGVLKEVYFAEGQPQFVNSNVEA